MKNLLILIVTFILIFALAACNHKKLETQQENSDITNGKWELVDSAYNPIAVDLSKSLPIPVTYRGKTINEIWDEAYQFYNGGRYPEGFTINWGEYPILSPDGKSAAYNSNKNCFTQSGESVFVLAVDTGEETLLIPNDQKNGYCTPVYWLDNKTLICKKATGEYVACNVDGKSTSINLKGDKPYILAWNGKFILYSPDFNSNTRYVASFHGNKLVEEGKIKCPEGDLAYEGAISPDGTKVALKIYNNKASENRILAIYDSKTEKLYKINNPNIEGCDDIAAINMKWTGKYVEVNFYTSTNQVEHNELWRYVN